LDIESQVWVRFLELEKERFSKVKTIRDAGASNVWRLGLDTTFMMSRFPAGSRSQLRPVNYMGKPIQSIPDRKMHRI